MCVTVSPGGYRVLYQVTLFRNLKHCFSQQRG